MYYKKIISQFIPPVITNIVRKKSKVVWKGVYLQWNDALVKTNSYSDEQIIDKVTEAALKVLEGKYPYERDSVVFEKIQYNWPLFTCFGYVLKEERRPASVVDFGGSLGSIYISNRWFFDENSIKQWIVVEQPNFVERGKQLFGDKNMPVFFADGISEVREMCKSKQSSVDVLLLSSVLQYLEDPYELLQQYIDILSPTYIIIDRTSFSASDAFVSTQYVNKQIVQSSYPCRFFEKEDFLDLFFTKRYEQILEFNSFCDPQHLRINYKEANWQGFLFKHNQI
ncbi:MAG: methyltransferase, TIGR04325 family [Bacteroidales bacterium]|jgi:putative methyltransferase (TIGR04325 family)|nr:methyltransferase, TIGR04325 family [Bacteroidales bacterium]